MIIYHVYTIFIFMVYKKTFISYITSLESIILFLEGKIFVENLKFDS